MTQWKTGLFSCFDDVPVCLLGTCCSCYLFGQNAEQISGKAKIPSCIKYAVTTPCCCASFIFHKPERQILRDVYKLEEKPSDFVASCICGACGNCQEAREIKLQGVQPGARIPISGQPR